MQCSSGPPDRSHAKSARSVAETMGNYHPHGDAVDLRHPGAHGFQPWVALLKGGRSGQFRSGNDPPAAMRYTEALADPAGDEMREIDEETVDFIPNYDGRVRVDGATLAGSPNPCWPTGQAASRSAWQHIPPHNLRELPTRCSGALENHDASRRRGDPGRGHSGLCPTSTAGLTRRIPGHR